MATNEVSICNLALNKLGAGTITSLSGASKQALACNANYELVRDLMLRAHTWNFSIARVELAESVDGPLYEFSHRYALPSDALRVISMENPEREFRVESGFLLTNEPNVNILYTRRTTDPAKFDPLFIDALATRLAAEMAIDLADNTPLYRALLEVSEQKVREARTIDSQEGTPRVLNPTYWLNARH